MRIYSTYPLFGNHRTLSSALQSRLLRFSSQDAEGEFNAAQWQLDDIAALVDYEPVLATPPPTQLKPVIWESVVGRGDIWPLRYWTDNDEPASYSLQPASLPAWLISQPHTVDNSDANRFRRFPYPRPFQLTLTMFSMICLVAAWAGLPAWGNWLAAKLHKWLAMSSDRSLAGRNEDRHVSSAYLSGCGYRNRGKLGRLKLLASESLDDAKQGERRLCVCAFFLTLLTIDLILMGFFLLPLEVPFSLSFPKFLGVIGLAGFAGLAAKLTSLGRDLFRLKNRPQVKDIITRPGPWLLSLVRLGMLALALAFLRSILSDTYSTRFYTFLRAAALRNGVSPLMTLGLVAIGILVALTCLLWRLALLDDCPLENGFLGLNGRWLLYRCSCTRSARNCPAAMRFS
jgi:hypothetical protein